MPTLTDKEKQFVDEYLKNHPIKKLPDHIPVRIPATQEYLFKRILYAATHDAILPTPIARDISIKD